MINLALSLLGFLWRSKGKLIVPLLFAAGGVALLWMLDTALDERVEAGRMKAKKAQAELRQVELRLQLERERDLHAKALRTVQDAHVATRVELELERDLVDRVRATEDQPLSEAGRLFLEDSMRTRR